MADAKHTPADDASFRASVLKQGGGAVVVVAASALVFWGIGALGGGPTVPSVSEGDVAAQDDADPDDEVEQAPDEPDDATDDPPAEEPPAEEPDDEPDDEGADEDGAEDEPDTEPDDEPDTDDAPQDAPSDDPDADAVDPASVSIQVLDGFKADGGAAAGAVAEELTGIGYRVIARNQALDYEVTTVLFNPGNEAAARRIARDLGGADVRAQPGNLSTQVDVHVVVGADRA